MEQGFEREIDSAKRQSARFDPLANSWQMIGHFSGLTYIWGK